MSIEIKLKRASKVYQPGDLIKGNLLIDTKSGTVPKFIKFKLPTYSTLLLHPIQCDRI